ncbi:MAG: fadH, partial [Brevundimonas sp.]|nr:fadH [Brevundimonas sp.]
DEVPVGKTVAVIGAGGIGHDVSEYLVERHEPPSIDCFFRTWGVDVDYQTAGGRRAPRVEPAERQVFLMQRSTGKVGDRLGRTTGWIHRAALKMHGVVTASGVAYRRIDDEGLHVTIDGAEKTIPVDHVVICAGQEPLRDLQDALVARGCSVHLIGGADVAAELDAKRAIDQGVRLAAAI